MVAGLAKHDVPAAPCLALADLPAHQQVLAIGVFEQTEHPLLGMVQHVTPPARFDGRKMKACGPSPALGEHGEDILAELDSVPPL